MPAKRRLRAEEQEFLDAVDRLTGAFEPGARVELLPLQRAYLAVVRNAECLAYQTFPPQVALLRSLIANDAHLPGGVGELMQDLARVLDAFRHGDDLCDSKRQA